jgi:hypothetical protein
MVLRMLVCVHSHGRGHGGELADGLGGELVLQHECALLLLVHRRQTVVALVALARRLQRVCVVFIAVSVCAVVCVREGVPLVRGHLIQAQVQVQVQAGAETVAVPAQLLTVCSPRLGRCLCLCHCLCVCVGTDRLCIGAGPHDELLQHVTHKFGAQRRAARQQRAQVHHGRLSAHRHRRLCVRIVEQLEQSHTQGLAEALRTLAHDVEHNELHELGPVRHEYLVLEDVQQLRKQLVFILLCLCLCLYGCLCLHESLCVYRLVALC